MSNRRARCRACGAEICENAAGETRRESIWSVSSAWKKAFFSILGVSLLISSVVIIAHTVLTMYGAGFMEMYMTAAERILISGGAQAILIYAVTDSWEATMVLANLIRQNLLEPLKERQRREGWEEGVEEGREEGREEGLTVGREEGLTVGREEGLTVGREEGLTAGRSESDAKWRAWNERREKAAASGEPFDEPPPSFDG